MTHPLQSLISTGTKLWLDTVDPDEVKKNRELGATGATSNPVIISGLIKTGRYDDDLQRLMTGGLSDEETAWAITNQIVASAQEVFLPVWEQTNGNDGYVSFELDPLIEDPVVNIPLEDRMSQYIELGKKWSKDQPNRMIKVPATPGGIDALEELVAAGVTVNVTLVFSPAQYLAARDACWRGAQRRTSTDKFKSVYSIFVSRVDVYADQHLSALSDEARGLVGIVNAKRIWQMNREFWPDKNLALDQEIIFASTGTKKPEDPPAKYVEAFAGSDIETNPPQTNDYVAQSNLTFSRRVDQLPEKRILDEIDEHLDMQHMEDRLMEEGIKKFADPQKELLALIAQKRLSLPV